MTIDPLPLLEAEIDRQIEGARKKQAGAWYWGPVGGVEERAAGMARAAIRRVAEERPGAGAGDCRAALEALLDTLRQADWDADGYGLGTVHAIIRALDRDG